MAHTDDSSPTAARLRKLALGVGWTCPPLLLVFARVTFHEDASCKTAYVTLTGRICFNPGFAASLPDKQLAFVLAHEAMHLILRHFLRRGGRDAKLWNVAGDRALNQVLREGGVGEPPADALFPPVGMEAATAEELYAHEEQQKQQSGDDGEGEGDSGDSGDSGAPATAGCGVVDDSSDGDGDGETREQLDHTWREIALQTASIARGTKAGNALTKLLKRPVPRAAWHRVVRSALASVKAGAGADDYSFDERGRSLSPRIIMPGTIATKATAAIVIDSSGSVSDTMLSAAVKHASDAARDFDVNVYLVVHDARVQWRGWIRGVKPESFEGKLRGRGGTNAEPAYAAVAKVQRRFATLVHLTDGELGAWPELPANVGKGIAALLKPRGVHTSKLAPRMSELLVEVETQGRR